MACWCMWCFGMLCGVLFEMLATVRAHFRDGVLFGVTVRAHLCEIDCRVLFGVPFEGCCWRCWCDRRRVFPLFGVYAGVIWFCPFLVRGCKINVFFCVQGLNILGENAVTEQQSPAVFRHSQANMGGSSLRLIPRFFGFPLPQRRVYQLKSRRATHIKTGLIFLCRGGCRFCRSRG